MIVFPGSDWFLVLRHASREGTRSASIVAIGLGLGSLLVTLLAIGGLNSLFAAYPFLIKVIRYLGAAWLLWQAIVTFFPHVATQNGANSKSSKPLLAGLVNHALNIEMILFYIAVISQLSAKSVNIPFQIGTAIEMAFFTALWFIFIAHASQKIKKVEAALNHPAVQIIIGILFLLSAYSLLK